MFDGRTHRALASFLCTVVCFLGCNRAPDQAPMGPGGGTKQEPAPGPQPVKDVDPGSSFSLEPLLGSEGNVHLYFLHRRPVAGEKPFLVVWTDARGYSGARGYPSAKNVPPAKKLVEGGLTLRYGGKDNDYDREVKCSFEITVGGKGQFKVDGKTYDFAKGALFLISAGDGKVRVKQVSRDPSQLPVDRDAVVAFAKADPDVKAFVSQKSKGK